MGFFFCKSRGLIILCLRVRHLIEREIKLFWFQTNLILFVHLCFIPLSQTRRTGTNRILKGEGRGEGKPLLIDDQVHYMTENGRPWL